MNSEQVKVSKIKANPNNPRIIRDEKFEKLKKSIQDFPEMLELRPIVVDNDYVVLGGNMRLKAIKDLGIKEVTVVKADSLTEEQKKEFIVKDNVGFGEWDFDALQEWDSLKLEEWGLDVPQFTNPEDIDLDDFFEKNNVQKEQKNKIILEYTEEEFQLVTEAFSKHSGSKEQIIFNLLIK
jgi:hypothetical protein